MISVRPANNHGLRAKKARRRTAMRSKACLAANVDRIAEGTIVSWIEPQVLS